MLIPMVGVYTPGLQALPACSWEFVELVTREGLTGTGEWSIELSPAARRALAYLREHPAKNLLAEEFEPRNLQKPLLISSFRVVLVARVGDERSHRVARGPLIR